VRLTFGGYNDKLEDFAKYITKQITTNLDTILPKDAAEFDRYQDLLLRNFAGFDVKQPYAHASYYAKLLTQPPGFQYSNQELLEATETITLPQLVSYVNSVWSSGEGIALVQGNVDEKQATRLINTIDETIAFKPIPFTNIPPELVPLPIPESNGISKGTRLVISEPNPENRNAASYVVIQGLSEEPKDHVMMEIISAIISERFYEELRTRQQLGYIVSAGIGAIGKTKTMGFVVQSSTAKNEKLTTEIIKYLDSIRPKFLETISKGDLAVYVKSLIDRKTEPDKQLATETTRNWAEIASGRLQFDRAQREVAALLDLTKEDLLVFWDRHYVNDGRRVLITEIIPQVGATSSPVPPTSTGYAASLKTRSTNTGTSSSSPLASSGLILGIDDIEIYRQNQAQLKTTDLVQAQS